MFFLYVFFKNFVCKTSTKLLLIRKMFQWLKWQKLEHWFELQTRAKGCRHRNVGFSWGSERPLNSSPSEFRVKRWYGPKGAPESSDNFIFKSTYLNTDRILFEVQFYLTKATKTFFEVLRKSIGHSWWSCNFL